MGQVRRAFREVVFARPGVSSEPVGGWALVNLDTYYAVVWPRAGVGPGEVARVRLLGHVVGIRPRVVQYRYVFGDGDSLGTVDAGGRYPWGRVRHRYQQTGRVRVGVSARYSADFSVDGGPFRGLDETVEVAGPTRVLTVYQARAELVPNPDES
jgi:hypothetical protein